MNGIQGREFSDHGVERRAGEGSVRIETEYRIHQRVDTDVYHAMLSGEFPDPLQDLPRRDERVSSLGGRILGHLLDSASRLAGLPTHTEVVAARAVRLQAWSSERADQHAAAAIADRLADRSDVEVRRVLPTIGQDPIPRDRALRWVRVATAAIDVIHAHVDHGRCQGVSPQIGRAARVAVLEDVRTFRRFNEFGSSGGRDATSPAPETLMDRLETLSAARVDQVRNYLATGATVDRALEVQSLSSKVPLAKLRHAAVEARSGVARPADVVEAARLFAREGGLRPGAWRQSAAPGLSANLEPNSETLIASRSSDRAPTLGRRGAEQTPIAKAERQGHPGRSTTEREGRTAGWLGTEAPGGASGLANKPAHWRAGTDPATEAHPASTRPSPDVGHRTDLGPEADMRADALQEALSVARAEQVRNYLATGAAVDRAR